MSGHAEGTACHNCVVALIVTSPRLIHLSLRKIYLPTCKLLQCLHCQPIQSSVYILSIRPFVRFKFL